MSGKRLLDVIAVFNAARAVAYNHFSIRQAQFELFARTSSLTRGVSRARQDVSNAAHSFRQSATAANAKPNSNPKLFNTETMEGEGQSVKGTEGVRQDHHYNRSQENSVADPVPNQDLEVQQDKANRYPLADGTIPSKHSGRGQAMMDAQNLSSEDAMKLQRQSEAQIPSQPAELPTGDAVSTAGDGSEFGVEQEQDTFYQPPDSTAPVLSALPRFKIPKTEEDVQGGDPHIPQQINADVFYSSRMLSQDDLANQTDKAQESPSDETMSSLFHSPRVAKLLGAKSKQTPGGIRPKGSRMYATSRPNLAQGKADLSDARSKDSETGKGSDTETESLRGLAANLAMETQIEPAVSTPRPTP
jgi:aarF domain-containing kinase